jgi:type I restriction enzyme S subunit
MRPYLRAANVGWAGLLLDDVKQMNFTDEEMGVYRLEPEDIVLSEASGSANGVGKPALWSGQIPDCAFQNTLLRVRSRGPAPRYLLHFFRHVALSQAFATRSRGVGIHHIGRKALASWQVPLPSLAEQQRIVEVLEDHLSRLEAAAAQVEAVQQRLWSWRRLAIDRLVCEQASGTTRLADLVARVEAGRSFGGTAPPAGPDEWGIIKVSAMTWGSFKAEENKVVPADKVDPRYEIQSGDVLVSRANTTEYVGSPVLVTSTRPRLLLSDKSLRIIPKPGTDRAWLATVLGARGTRRQISRLATGTKDSMRNISQSSLLSVEVPVANARQQREVVARAALVEGRAKQLDTELSNSLRRGRTLRRSLLAAAFSGRLA